MSKRLVKTAKQQFEEELRGLSDAKTFKLMKDESVVLYYGHDAEGNFRILRRYYDKEYSQSKFNCSYDKILADRRLVETIGYRFVERDLPLGPLFDWYASADRKNEPFTIFDVYMSGLAETRENFKDIYE